MCISGVLSCEGCGYKCVVVPIACEILEGYYSTPDKRLHDFADNIIHGRRIVTICQKTGKPVQSKFMD